MKKTLICILAIAFLIPLGSHAEGLFGFFFGTSSSGMTLQFIPAQEEAFFTLDGHQEARLLGASGDGKMLLLFSPFEVYLWDQSAHVRVPITFVRPEDAETMTQLAPKNVINLTGRNLKPEQRKERLDQLTEKQEQYLAQRNLTAFANLDQISECFPHLVELRAQCAGISDHWALVNCVYYPCSMAIDLRNGEALVFFQDHQPRSFCGDRILFADGILDLETREMTTMDKLGLMPAEDDGRPDLDLGGLSRSMRLCADGSLLAIGCDGALDFDNGNDYWLVDVRTDSNSTFKIGNFLYSYAPSTLLASKDERWLLLYNDASVLRKSVLVADRGAGQTRELESGRYLPVAAAGKGFLMWDLSTYDVVFFEPETNAFQKVTLGSGFDWTRLDLTSVSSIVGNGTGMLFMPSPMMRRDGEPTIVHGYFVLEGE